MRSMKDTGVVLCILFENQTHFTSRSIFSLFLSGVPFFFIVKIKTRVLNRNLRTYR